MPLIIESVTIPFSEVERVKLLESNLESDQRTIDALTTERNKLSLDLEAAKKEQSLLQQATSELAARNQSQAKEIETLNIELVQLKTPLATAPQKVTRAFLPRIYGLTIEKSKESPSPSLYTKVKGAMKWGQGMGFNYWRGFFNFQEIADHLKPSPPLGNLVTYGLSLGLRPIADTIDTIALNPKIDDTAFKIYLDGLAKLGFEGVFINDANRADLPLETLKAIVARIRRLAPDMPIFASLLATANLATYKEIVDHVEIQTFGTPSELSNFLALDDKLAYPVIVCLDARAAMTANDLATRAAIILKNPPSQFFYYADLPGDYDAMPDSEDVVIKGLVALLKAR